MPQGLTQGATAGNGDEVGKVIEVAFAPVASLEEVVLSRQRDEIATVGAKCHLHQSHVEVTVVVGNNDCRAVVWNEDLARHTGGKDPVVETMLSSAEPIHGCVSQGCGQFDRGIGLCLDRGRRHS